MRTRRRALVLADESARHPFRRSLPPHVLKGGAAFPARRNRWRITGRDSRDFLAAYCASFAAVTVFIS